MSEDLKASEQEEQQGQQKEGSQEAPSATAELASKPDRPDESHTPEFLAHTDRKDIFQAARYAPLYRVGKAVYLKGARSYRGPYTISKVYSDCTYELNDESGRPFKDKVPERDLKPV